MRATALPMPFANADAAEYWRSAEKEELALQKCKGCGAARFPARHLCPVCWSDQAEWTRASGRGTIYAATVVRRAPSPEYKDMVPYVLALIDLEEGPRMITNLVGDGALNWRIGDAVRVTFERRVDGVMPQFELVGNG
jgi:uncharacterized protein